MNDAGPLAAALQTPRAPVCAVQVGVGSERLCVV